MKLFRKMDEMEIAINFKALRIVHLFTMAYLFVWLACIFVSNRYDPRPVVQSWAFLLLISQVVIQLNLQWIFRANMSKDDNNEK
jgi:hypothetical protein